MTTFNVPGGTTVATDNVTEPETATEKETENPTPESSDESDTTNTESVPPSDAATEPVPTAPVDAILDAIMSRVAPATEVQIRRKVFVYGDPGTRKSTFLGTAPHSLIIDVEDGLASLKNHPDMIDLSKIDILPFRSFYQVETLVDRALMGNPMFDKYETFSIDSISDLHKKGLAEVMAAGFKRGVNRSKYVAETDDENDHAENNEHIRQLVASLRSLDKNIILTAHARTAKQKDGSFKVYPDFSEKLANTISAMMDVVAYVEKVETNGKVDAVWWFESDGYVMAKNRIGLPDKMVNPTWADLEPYFNK